MWVQLSDDELIQRSDLVVLGAWVGQTEVSLSAAAGSLALGVIAITEVLKGPPAQGIALVVVPSRDAPRSSSDIAYRSGDRGLWLLRQRPGAESGLYLADNPQRFVPAATGAARIDSLRRALARR